MGHMLACHLVTMSGVIRKFPVEKEYEKNPDISREDIKKLREWLNTQPHLPDEYITELDLVLTYFCCERSPEVSKQVLDLHYTIRTLFTPIFKDRKVDKTVTATANMALLTPLPSPTVYGYRALFCGLIDSDPKRFVFVDIIRLAMMIIDLWQYGEGSWPGFVVIIDMDKSTMGHVSRLDLMTVRQTLYFLQECMLLKLKEVHFINAPTFVDKVMVLLKPFMKKALMDMIKIHERGSDSLYEFVPKKALPKDLGGDYKDKITLRDEMLRFLEDNEQFFKDENRRRVNESLRPDGKKTVEELLGIQGSFKKLDID